MEYLIIKIARLLRKSGIDVSPGEIKDCIEFLKLTDPETINKYNFYNILNSTLVKSPWGSDYVLWLVELYFGPDIEVNSDFTGLLEHRYNGQNVTGGSTGRIVPIEQLIDAVLKNEISFIYSAVINQNLNLDIHIENREKALELFQYQSRWNDVSNHITGLYNKHELTETEYAAAKDILKKWNNFLKYEIERRLARNMSQDYLLAEMKKKNPRTVSFLESDDSQVFQMSREIQKLGRKLAIRKGRRRKPGSKGLVSLSRTIRHSLKTGGIPLKLIRMKRKPSKPDLWLICDMSNSVSKFLYFMLLFVYTVQKRYTSIRSFIFVDMLIEVTDFFTKQDWVNVIHNLRKIRGYNITGFSHYGNAFYKFSDEYLQFLNKKTTVVILGDAKNNRNRLNGSEVLTEIREKAAALYWLNPLTPDRWEKDDCIMNIYRNNCTGVFPCSNIEELENFIRTV